VLTGFESALSHWRLDREGECSLLCGVGPADCVVVVDVGGVTDAGLGVVAGEDTGVLTLLKLLVATGLKPGGTGGKKLLGI